MDLPRYSTGRGPEDLTLDIVPPFLFPGTTLRVFPLKANIFRLRHFCETYLNLMPPTIARFRPALPFVYLMVLDYGRMAVEEANLGWISQHEITFSVPLEWHRQRADGRWELVDQVYVNPFIFVDSPMSLSTGREVYGWSKLRVELSPGIHSWISDPRGPQRLLSLRIKDLPGMPRSTLLAEIVSEPPPNPSLVPLDLNNAWNPLVSIPQTLLGTWRLLQDFLDVSAALPIRGYAADNPLTFFERLLQTGRRNGPFQSPSSSGIVTLKQFRDAEDPAYACYQALVYSEMTTRRFNRGGLLGDLNLLRGDWTGGYRVRIHHLNQLPILESLGLEVAREVGFESSYAATLRPVFPFWLDLDLQYGRGRTVCWRTRSSKTWKTARGAPFPGAPGSNATSSGNLYNTIQGSAVLPGPFVAPQAVMHAFPLKADRERLGRFIDTYLDLDGLLDEHGRPILVFEGLPDDAEVYLVASTGTSFAESTAALGPMTAREMGLYIPVLVREDGRTEAQVALFAPFIFSDNSMFAIADREMIGQTMVEATLEGASDAWLPGPPVPRTLLQVTTDVFLGLGLGLGAEKRVLLEIVESGQPPAKESAGPIPPEETASVARQLSRNVIILKQFRDAERPSLACFQSIVSVEQVGEVLAAGRVPDNVYVRIHRYPSHPIADVLGLIPDPSLDPVDASAGMAVQSFRPRRAVWTQVSLRLANRREVCWRAGSKTWSRRPGELLFFDDASQKEKETPAALEPDAKASTAPQPAAVAQTLTDYIEFTWDQQLPAPYTFKDVRLRGFTLTASYDRLAQLCDRFLNFDGLHYQPFPTLLPGLSIVYLQALTYGAIRSLVPLYEQSGFVQQDEIYFTIPVIDPRTGDYGLFTPIIFVSNPWSLTAGREVLGFPKGLGQFELPMDVDHPYPIRVQTMAFQEFHPATRLSWGPLLEILEKPGTPAAIETDLKDLWPFGDLRGLHGDRGPVPLKKDYFQRLEEIARRMSYSSLQLKQFRGVLAAKAAYQKVVRSTVKLTALDDGGLLPPARLELFETQTLPVAEILGLDVRDGFVEPYIPFWLDCSFDFLDPVVLER